jgi:hypothetical protein
MVDSPMNIVPLGGNRNKIGLTGRSRCSCSGLISTNAQIGASVGVMSHFTIVETLTISLRWVLGCFGSSKHSDFQQQESRNCWGADSLGAAE